MRSCAALTLRDVFHIVACIVLLLLRRGPKYGLFCDLWYFFSTLRAPKAKDKLLKRVSDSLQLISFESSLLLVGCST